MGKFLGETAGFAMLILIGILFLKMLEEFKIVSKRRIMTIRRLSLQIIVLGLGYLVLGSFFYNISIEEAGVFQYDQIWGYGNYAYIMEHVELGVGDGIFNRLYISFAHIAGKIFFGQYISASIYVSFLFSILYGLGIFFLLHQFCSKKIADQIFPFFFLCPFGYKLFLPSPVSMICCCFVGILCLVRKILEGKERVHKIQGINCPWVYDLSLCMWVGINIMLYYTEMLIR